MYMLRKSIYNKKEVKNMSIYGYARVSTKEQNEDRQVQALLDYGIKKVMHPMYLDEEQPYLYEEFCFYKKV